MSVPAESEELPPSAKLLVYILQGADQELTRKQLVERSQLAPATVDRSLRRLQGHDLLETTPHPSDGRRQLYELDANFPSK
jgi:DNA-binding MarR family transcriptional regulator